VSIITFASFGSLRKGHRSCASVSDSIPDVIVDGHVHLFRAASEEYPREISRTFPAEREAMAPGLLVEMDRAGVDRAVVIPLTEDDRYLREALDSARDRLVGLGVHDDHAPVTIDQLRRRVAASGLQGLRMFGLGSARAGGDVDDPEALTMLPLLRAMADDGLILSFYPTVADLPALASVLRALPGLQVLLNHQGFCHEGAGLDEQDDGDLTTAIPPSYYGAVLDLARFPNCHLMFSGHYAYSSSGYPYLDLKDLVGRSCAAFGPERLVWGSDYPLVADDPGYGETLSTIDHLLDGIDPHDRARILGGNAARLYRFA
jgi:L-fuconolactonase